METAFYIICAIFTLLVLFVSYVFYVQRRNKILVANKKVVTILRKDGDRDDLLLPVVRGQIIYPIKLNGKRIIRRALVRPEKGFDVFWPFGKPKILQAKVRSYIIPEGDTEPYNPFQTEPIVTDEVMGNLQDEAFSRAMVARGEELEEEIELRKPRRKKNTGLFIIIGVILVVLIVVAVLATTSGSIKLP